MPWRSKKAAALVPVALIFAFGCEDQPGEAPIAQQHTGHLLSVSADTASILSTLSPAPSLPQDPTNRYADHPLAAHFGQYLFFDTALSASGEMSCATCHRPDRAFTDGLPVAIAASIGTRNTPSVINAAHFAWLNWDGSADTLWGQATRPFEAQHELGTTRTAIAKVIGTDRHRREAYEAIFGKLPPRSYFEELPADAMPVVDNLLHPASESWASMSTEQQETVNTIFVNVCKAIAAYQRQIVATDAPFDRFAATLFTEDRQQWVARANPGFDEPELRGLELFTSEAGCIACHAGPFFTDFTFHGVRVSPAEGGPPVDPGRFEGLRSLLADSFNSAGIHSDSSEAPIAQRLSFMSPASESWGKFRTPSLRNVALTAPYMHAGQFPDLDRVLEHYSTFEGALPPDHHAVENRLLRPLGLSEQQKSDLKAFLVSLTDTSISPSLLKQPASPLPMSGQAKTGR